MFSTNSKCSSLALKRFNVIRLAILLAAILNVYVRKHYLIFNLNVIFIFFLSFNRHYFFNVYCVTLINQPSDVSRNFLRRNWF